MTPGDRDGVVGQAVRRLAPSQAHGCRTGREESPQRPEELAPSVGRGGKLCPVLSTEAQDSAEASVLRENPVGLSTEGLQTRPVTLQVCGFGRKRSLGWGECPGGPSTAVAVGTCCPPVAVQPVSTSRGLEQGGPL